MVCAAHRLQCKTPHFPKHKFPAHTTFQSINFLLTHHSVLCEQEIYALENVVFYTAVYGPYKSQISHTRKTAQLKSTLICIEINCTTTICLIVIYPHPSLCSFEPLYQKVCLNSLKSQELLWPPKKPANNASIQARKRSSFDFKLICGDSEGRFEFGLYRFVDPAVTPPSVSSSEVLQPPRGLEQDGRSFEESPAACIPVKHQAVDMPVA